MKFNNHSDLNGKHAFLSASQYSWINYDDEKLVMKLDRTNRVILGTAIHEYACNKIKLCSMVKKNKKQIRDEIKLAMMSSGKYASYLCNSVDDLPNEVFDTTRDYINDCIKFNMKPEQILFYSSRCFGTADAISFDGELLRIYDLKTGTIPAHMEQLIIYAALFCLEYVYKPYEISIELRIYQNDEIVYFDPQPEDISPVMDKICRFDDILQQLKEEE